MGLNLQLGNIPIAEFRKDELYKTSQKYTHTRVSLSSLKVIPSRESITEYYYSNKHDVSLLTGNKAHTLKAIELYNYVINEIKPTEQEIIDHLIGEASKLNFMDNELDKVLDFMSINAPIIYPHLDTDTIYHIVDCSQMGTYTPQQKCVIFNPVKELNPIFKQHIQQQEIGKYNAKRVVELAKMGKTRQQIASLENLSLQTVKKHLQSTKTSTKGSKKKATKQRIWEWKSKNKKGTQKQCSERLNISLRTVKNYW